MIPHAILRQLACAVIRQTDNAFKGIKTPYDNVIDITYYRSKKEAVKGKYNFTTGVITLADNSQIAWRH